MKKCVGYKCKNDCKSSDVSHRLSYKNNRTVLEYDIGYDTYAKKTVNAKFDIQKGNYCDTCFFKVEMYGMKKLLFGK